MNLDIWNLLCQEIMSGIYNDSTTKNEDAVYHNVYRAPRTQNVEKEKEECTWVCDEKKIRRWISGALIKEKEKFVDSMESKNLA